MKRILFAVFLTFMTLSMHAQMFVVGTEATSTLLMAPSVSMELVTSDKSSIALNGLWCGGSWLPALKKAKVKVLQPEYRYWFSGRPIHGWFVGAGGLAALYDITHKGKVYDGYALGLGATYGYVLNLTNRLNIDFHGGFGLIMYKRKEYYLHDNFDAYYSIDGQQRANANGYYLLPTRVGVTVSYVLK